MAMLRSPAPPATPIKCRSCGSTHCEDLGPVLHYTPHRVAGVDIDLSGLDFHLIRCRDCGLVFKDPPIPEQRLLDCYARADAGTWSLNPDPWIREFDILKAVVERHAPGPRVVDVGCSNGALLQWLGNKFTPFGVEPSEAAAKVARERGIDVVAARIEDVPATLPPMHAILGIDLAEHIVDPPPFFRRAHDLLVDGGVLILLTGDTTSPNWSRVGSLYWYCSLPEHVTFYNRAALESVGRQTGFRVVHYERIPHQRGSLPMRSKEWAKNWFYYLGTKLRWLGIRPLQRKFDRCGPMWLTGRDHLLAVLQRVA